VQPLVEYDTMDKHPNCVLKGGWYIGPRETLKESVLGPLPYIVQGKQVWLATLSVPIIVDGRFMGVAGADPASCSRAEAKWRSSVTRG